MHWEADLLEYAVLSVRQARQRDAGRRDSRPWDEEFVGEFREEAARVRPARVYHGSGYRQDARSSDFEARRPPSPLALLHSALCMRARARPGD